MKKQKRFSSEAEERGFTLPVLQPRCYQFCSLKDSGIRNLANAEGVVVARDQARHSDVAVTNKYIQQHEAHECTKHFKGALD